MRVLDQVEMLEVSGAYGWNWWANIGEAIVSVTLGAVAGGTAGAVIGGKHGGDGGGLLGFGAIGQGVGMIGGGLIGAVTCGIGGGILGFDTTVEYTKKALDGFISGAWIP